jgi:hypothetical protein
MGGRIAINEPAFVFENQAIDIFAYGDASRSPIILVRYAIVECFKHCVLFIFGNFVSGRRVLRQNLKLHIADTCKDQGESGQKGGIEGFMGAFFAHQAPCKLGGVWAWRHEISCGARQPS